jgi:uncharacterized protein YqjF (DUF2071 family)
MKTTTAIATKESPVESSARPHGKPFLTAAWRDLLMLNFEIDAAVLEPYLPRGVEVDLHEGRALMSMVAFVFERPRLYGIPAPLSARIPEINLRFYVRRHVDGQWRPGIVFIKEIAPWRALPMAMVANHWYHEHYHLMPVRHQLRTLDEHDDARQHIHYAWKYRGHWNRLAATASGTPHRPVPGSDEAFILDHWFAYTRQPDGSCIERQVDHPLWNLQAVDLDSLQFRADVSSLYGAQFVDALSQSPTTAFFSSGSAVGVFGGTLVE